MVELGGRLGGRWDVVAERLGRDVVAEAGGGGGG